MARVIYLLGAGASANALPVVQDMPSRLLGMANVIENEVISNVTEASDREYLTSVANDFREMREKAIDFGTVDTYAKYLFHRESEKYYKLKDVLSAYFVFEQLHHKCIDKRYLTWLVSVVNGPVFNNDVKILSWNYDFQMQLAAHKYGYVESISSIGSGIVASLPFITYHPRTGFGMNATPNDTSLLHLNGLAGYFDNGKFKTNLFITQNIDSYLNHLPKHKMGDYLNFSWEDHKKQENAEYLATMCAGAEILVIIGYSFPFFNRNIDKDIFGYMRSSLKKIYIQNILPMADQLKAQFNLYDLNVVDITQTSQFHIPYEL